MKMVRLNVDDRCDGDAIPRIRSQDHPARATKTLTLIDDDAMRAMIITAVTVYRGGGGAQEIPAVNGLVE